MTVANPRNVIKGRPLGDAAPAQKIRPVGKADINQGIEPAPSLPRPLAHAIWYVLLNVVVLALALCLIFAVFVAPLIVPDERLGQTFILLLVGGAILPVTTGLTWIPLVRRRAPPPEGPLERAESEAPDFDARWKESPAAEPEAI